MKKTITVLLIAVLIFSTVGGVMAYQGNETNKAQIEARGVWHRPNVTNEETTLSGVCSVLDKFQYAGINLVFLEVFYHGMTVFKTPQVAYYTGFDSYDYGPYEDYLSAFTAEAEKRGIEVHAWVEDFYIGVKTNNFVKYCASWLLLNSEGSYRQSEGKEYGGYIFLDPANAEVRQFLCNFYAELLTKFPSIKGLNLDYIRYPVSDTNDDTGFTKTAMAQFAAQQGLALQDDSISTFIDTLKRTGSYAKFTDFRASMVTQFVKEVHDMIKEKHPGVLLSTAIFPETSLSYNQKKQDFTAWLAQGYLDIVTPMAYYDDNSALKSALAGMMKNASDTYCYAGLSSTYHSLSNSHVQEQLAVCREVGTDGFVFFGSQSLLGKQGYLDMLHEAYGSTTKQSITPHSSISALFDAIAYPAVNALLQEAAQGKENEKQILELQSELEEIASIKEDSLFALDEAARRLSLLTKYNLAAYVSSQNLSAVKEAFERLCRYASVYAVRARAKALLPALPPLPEEPTPPQAPTPPKEETPPEAPKAPEQTGKDSTEKNRTAASIAVSAAAAAVTTAAVAAKKRKKRKNAD